MKTRVRVLCRIVTSVIGRIRAASRPVKATVAAELGAAGALALLAWSWLGPVIDRLVDLDRLPPWPLLAAGPVIGVAAALVRAWRPDEPLRRWHGVLLRRVDERFG